MITKQRSVFVIQTRGKILLCSPWSRQLSNNIIQSRSSFKTEDTREKYLIEIKTYQKIKSRIISAFSPIFKPKPRIFLLRMIGLQLWHHWSLQSIIVIRNSELLIWNNDGWSLLWTFGQCWPLSNVHFEHLEGRVASHLSRPRQGPFGLWPSSTRRYNYSPIPVSHRQSYIHA